MSHRVSLRLMVSHIIHYLGSDKLETTDLLQL